MGKVLKSFVKVTVAAAAVGGICYAFKDKIKDSKVYKEHDVDGKIAKVKTTIKEKMPKIFDNEKDYVEDDEIFFDDLDDTAARDYVSIDTDTDDSSEKTEGEVATAAPHSAPENEPSQEIPSEADSDAENDVPTIDIN